MSERTGEALVFRWTRTIMDGSSAAGQMRLRKDGSGTPDFRKNLTSSQN